MPLSGEDLAAEVGRRYGAPVQMMQLKHGIFDEATISVIAKGPSRWNLPLHSSTGRSRKLGDWRGKTLAKVRTIIHEADPEIVEEWKWRGTPVWSHGGIVCPGETQ
jgi:hypothetical protein